MADHAAFGPLATGVNDAHGDTRGTRGDDGIRGARVIDLGEQLDLEIRTLWPVLLDEVGTRKRFLHAWSERQPGGCRVRSKPNGCERRPSRINVLAQFGFRVRSRIGCDYIESRCKVLRCPARADETCADDRDAAYWFVRRHDWILLSQ